MAWWLPPPVCQDANVAHIPAATNAAFHIIVDKENVAPPVVCGQGKFNLRAVKAFSFSDFLHQPTNRLQVRESEGAYQQ